MYKGKIIFLKNINIFKNILDSERSNKCIDFKMMCVLYLCMFTQNVVKKML